MLILGIALSATSLSKYISTHINTRGMETAPPPLSITQAEAPATSANSLSDQARETPSPTRALLITPARPFVSPARSSVLPAQPSPTPTIVWTGAVPTYIRIPTLNLQAPIIPIDWETVTVDGTSQAAWNVPDWYAVGWHHTSAKLGVPGNTVLNGHNAGNGEVFRNLYTLEAGALISVDAEDGKTYTYKVREIYFLKEANQPLEVRIENARHIQATDDERLTLVTCHPYGSFAQRLLVIAYPNPDQMDAH